MTQVTTAGPAERVRAPRPAGRRSFTKLPLVYIVPTLVILLAFAAYPMFVLVRMSLSDVGPSNIIGEWPFVGLQNFVDVVSGSEVWASTLRTAFVAAFLLCSNLIIGFLAASVLSVKGRLTTIVLGIMVFVWALPPLVSGSLWKFLLDDSGAVNAVLGVFGLPSVSWLSEPDLALWSVAAVIAWASLPFSILIIRGGLLAISPDVLEAAALDGAGYWRTRFQVVLPLLRPTLWILGILTVLYAFKSFDFFYVLTRGGPGTVTTTLPVQSYNAAFSNFAMSTGATIAVISMLFVILIAVPYVRSIRMETTE